MMIFLLAIVVSLVKSECVDTGGHCSRIGTELCGNGHYANSCKKTCGKCAVESTAEKCVHCLNDYFGNLDSGDSKDEAKEKLEFCRESKKITKEECDAEPCYQDTYKDCRKTNKESMSFAQWSEKCLWEAKECDTGHFAATKTHMYKDFCEAELELCERELGTEAEHCDTVESCITSVPTAIQCVACMRHDHEGGHEHEPEHEEFLSSIRETNHPFDTFCLEKNALTKDGCENSHCAMMVQDELDHSHIPNTQIERYLFECAGGPLKCMVSHNVVGYRYRYNKCCAEANSVWDETFTRIVKCCKHGTDPNTADGCTPPLPCIKAGNTLPNGRECCPRAKAEGQMCVAKARVCEPCDCQKWDGKNYSICTPRPRSECVRYCVKCENDGVTPMKGDYTKHAARCAEYADGGIAEAQLKDLLRELLF